MERMDLTINILLTHTTGNQLGILGPEIKNKDIVLHGQK